MAYEAVIRAVAESLNTRRLRLVSDTREVVTGSHRIPLENKHFAFYAMLANARKQRRRPNTALRLGADYFGWMSLDCLGNRDSLYLRDYYEFLCATYRGDTGDTVEDRLADTAEKLHVDYPKVIQGFRQTKSRLDGETGEFVKQVPNPMIRDRIGIKSFETEDGETCFGLLFEPNLIEIAESE